MNWSNYSSHCYLGSSGELIFITSYLQPPLYISFILGKYFSRWRLFAKTIFLKGLSSWLFFLVSRTAAIPFAATMCHRSTKRCFSGLQTGFFLPHEKKYQGEVHMPIVVFFLLLLQSKPSSSIPWEPGCRMQSTDTTSVSQNKGERDNTTFTLIHWTRIF